MSSLNRDEPVTCPHCGKEHTYNSPDSGTLCYECTTKQHQVTGRLLDNL